MSSHSFVSTTPTPTFAGFASPTSNTVYTPNQFFDVCLRHGSRGCIRVVAFLIRQTLGWSDRDGKPLRERHAVNYSDFENAGIGKDTIKGALAEAIAGKFIRCVREPASASAGLSPVVGLYELNWDDGAEYIKDPQQFSGFFAGEGNRTFIPNDFFDRVVPRETLAVTKVVGSVIRFSIGFQTKWGHRRQQIALSYQDIQNYARVGSRDTLSSALKRALAANYLTRVSEGFFDRNAGRLSVKACYALKWLNQGTSALSARESVPAKIDLANPSENRTDSARKTVPAKHSGKRTDIERTMTKNINKQQDAAVVFEELKSAGFDTQAACYLANHYPAARVMRQIELLADRSASRNRLGLLRRAIEEDWIAPSARPGNYGRPKSIERQGFTDLAGALRRWGGN